MTKNLQNAIKIVAVAILSLTSALFLFHELRARRNHPASVPDGKPLSAAASLGNSATVKASALWQEAYGKLPMGFVENQGQADSDVLFTSEGQGYAVALTSQGAVLSLRQATPGKKSVLDRTFLPRTLRKHAQTAKTSVLAVKFFGANPSPKIRGQEKLSGRTDFFRGSDSKNWHTNVPSYGRVAYEGVYPGVDLTFYGNHSHLEYDFVVAPGASPESIALDVSGAQRIETSAQGNIVIRAGTGSVQLEKPHVYQQRNGERIEVAGNYVVSSDRRVRFSVGNYDRTEPLVIDPILNYSIFLGGSADDIGFGIAIDGKGNAYVTGETFSTNFPTTANAFSKTNGTGIANGAVFVTQLNPTGTAELYSTYLSGSGGESGFAIALDSSNNIYVTGQTLSTDYPTTANGFNPALAANPNGTAFLSVINPAASGAASLIYSTFLGGTAGGTDMDSGNAVAVDANQNAYIVGFTISADFPLMNSIQNSLKSPAGGNAFLTRIDTTKSGAASLIFSTFLGGSAATGDMANGVAVNSSNSNAYLIGSTTSADFPTTANAFLQAAPTGIANSAVFLSQIDTTKSGAAALVYSSYVAGATVGAFGDFGLGIALGPNNVAYLTGKTISADFPVTTGSFQSPFNEALGLGVAFVALIDTSQMGATSLKYSATLGGNNGDTGFGIQADSNSNAVVVGTTSSADFPVTPGAFQQKLKNPAGGAFISKLNPGGNGTADLVYSTFLSGSGATGMIDFGMGIAIDANNDAFVTGQTGSADFPIPGIMPTLKGPSDAFVTSLKVEPAVTISPLIVNFPAIQVGSTAPAAFVTLTNNTGSALPVSFALSGANAADFAASASAPMGGTPCPATLPAAATPCTVGVTFKPTVNGPETAKLAFSYTVLGTPAEQVIVLNGTGTNLGVIVSPASLTFASQLVMTTSAAQMVTVLNTTANTLMINSVAASGDFAETNTCGASVAGFGNCTISVTFTPTMSSNPRTGTLTIMDSDPSSPQTVALSGTAADFSISANPVTFNVTKGQTSQPVVLTVTGLGGFNQSVTLACTGAPKDSTCNIQPNSVTPGTPANLTLVTQSLIVAPDKFRTPPPSMRQIILVVTIALSMAGLIVARRRRTRMSFAGVLVLFSLLLGCGGGSSGTPRGPFTLTVTGSSGGVMHSITINGNVN
jgi:hypothetical protein